MKIENLEKGAGLDYYLDFFNHYGKTMCKGGRTYTHIAARNIYDEVEKDLSIDDLHIVRDALVSLSDTGVDWIKRGRLVAYLTWEKESHPEVDSKSYANAVKNICSNEKSMIKCLDSYYTKKIA